MFDEKRCVIDVPANQRTPVELQPAFRTARSGQLSQVVGAPWTSQVEINCIPIGLIADEEFFESVQRDERSTDVGLERHDASNDPDYGVGSSPASDLSPASVVVESAMPTSPRSQPITR